MKSSRAPVLEAGAALINIAWLLAVNLTPAIARAVADRVACAVNERRQEPLPDERRKNARKP